MAHKVYATLIVTVIESAFTFQESGFCSAAVGAEDFASGAVFGAAAKAVGGFPADATCVGFGEGGNVADGVALGVALPCCLSPPETVISGEAATATAGVFGVAASVSEGEAGATFGVGTTAGLRAGSCSLTLMGWDSLAG